MRSHQKASVFKSGNPQNRFGLSFWFPSTKTKQVPSKTMHPFFVDRQPHEYLAWPNSWFKRAGSDFCGRFGHQPANGSFSNRMSWTRPKCSPIWVCSFHVESLLQGPDCCKGDRPPHFYHDQSHLVKWWVKGTQPIPFSCSGEPRGWSPFARWKAPASSCLCRHEARYPWCPPVGC